MKFSKIFFLPISRRDKENIYPFDLFITHECLVIDLVLFLMIAIILAFLCKFSGHFFATIFLVEIVNVLIFLDKNF